MKRSTPQIPSHSRYASWHHCERQAYHRYTEGLEGKTESAPAYLGSALHVGLAALYSRGLSHADEACEAMTQWWNGQRFGGDWSWVTPGHAEVVLRNYADHWQKRGDNWEVEAVYAEERIEAEFPGFGPVMITPDLVVRLDGKLWVVDHKTTPGWLGGKFKTRVDMSHQLRIYCKGVESLMGEPVAGGICNAIHSGKNAAKPNTKTNLYERYPYNYLAGDYAETLAWLKAGRRKEANFAGQEESEHGQNPGGLCSWCDYQPLCQAQPRARQMVKMQKFKRRER